MGRHRNPSGGARADPASPFAQAPELRRARFPLTEPVRVTRACKGYIGVMAREAMAAGFLSPGAGQWANRRPRRNLSTIIHKKFAPRPIFALHRDRSGSRMIPARQRVRGPGTVKIGKPTGGPVGKPPGGPIGKPPGGPVGEVSGVPFGVRCKDSASEHWRLLFCPGALFCPGLFCPGLFCPGLFCPGFDGVPRPYLPSPRGRALLSKCGAKPSSPPFDWPFDWLFDWPFDETQEARQVLAPCRAPWSASDDAIPRLRTCAGAVLPRRAPFVNNTL